MVPYRGLEIWTGGWLFIRFFCKSWLGWIPVFLLIAEFVPTSTWLRNGLPPAYFFVLFVALIPGSGLATFLRTGKLEIKKIPEQVDYIVREFADGKRLYEPLKGELIYDKLPMPAASRLYSTFTVPFINDFPVWRGESLKDGFLTSPERVRAEVVDTVSF